MALSADRKTDQISPNAHPTLLSFPVAAATTIYGGAMVSTDAAGRAIPASATGTQKIWGACEKKADNAAGAAAAIQCQVRRGAFYFANGTGVNAIAQADVGELCYASDDLTVNKTNNGGAYPPAGVIMNVRADGQIGVLLGSASLYDIPQEAADQLATAGGFRARGVATGNHSLSAFTVGTNTDGLTYVAGDIVLLIAQTTPAQNGPYVVGTVATTAPLTRPDWFDTGSAFKSGTVIEVGGEGTLFKNTQWKATAAAGVVGTNDPAFYPKSVNTGVTLVAGTAAAITTIPVLSATKTLITFQRTVVNTASSTIMYSVVPVPTAGVAGAASIVPMAVVAAGTINVADISTLIMSVHNW
jgi:hypothetical protein